MRFNWRNILIAIGQVLDHARSLWSYKCQTCGKEEDNCNCQEKELERKLNPHFHVLGFGYLKGNDEF